MFLNLFCILWLLIGDLVHLYLIQLLTYEGLSLPFLKKNVFVLFWGDAFLGVIQTHFRKFVCFIMWRFWVTLFG